MNKFNVVLSFFVVSIMSLSTPAYSFEIEPIGALVGIRDAPEIGSKYRIDDNSYGAAPVTLMCQLQGKFQAFSACHLDANVHHLFLDMTKDNFTGRNVSGRKIEFIGVKHGQLFFKLLE